MRPLATIGRAERVLLLDHGPDEIPAKIDTGADISSIGASAIGETAEGLSFVLFDENSKYYTGTIITVKNGDYKLTKVANSFGDKEMRFVVKLRLRVQGRVVKTTFTLADRSKKLYPILLGRRLLANKFVVDVTKGDPLIKEERARLRRLHVALEISED